MFKLFVEKLWIYVFCPIWSFIINCCYWSGRPFLIKDVQDEKKRLLTLELADLLSKFKWTKDNFKDWTPWIITIVERELRDDCDGAAVLAKWWWKNHNINSRIIRLSSSDFSIGYTVCVLDDNTKVVSNGGIYSLDANNWQQNLLNLFNNQFTIIL